MGKLKLYSIIAAVLVLTLVGFTSLRSARPIVELKAETLVNIGPFPLTNTILTSWIVIVLLALTFYLATRKMALVPRGIQNFVEMVVEAFYNLVTQTVGEKHGRRFFPVVCTIFLYVVASNWLGLFPTVATVGKVEPLESHGEVLEEGVVFDQLAGINVIMPGVPSWPPHEPKSIALELPANATEEQKKAALDEATKDLKPDQKAGRLVPFFRSVNTDINGPLALAIMSAIFVEYWGISTLGFFRYGSKFLNVKRLLKGDILNGGIDLFVGMLEFVAELARLLSFTFRLFGNIFAGEILFLVIIFLLPVLALDMVYGMELFVGLIQAFIFAILTLVFGVIAVTSHEEGETHEREPAAPP
ncbi:MAG: F0F1 ATP synthase subunit A [Dehalococcoidia bacterium]|nr:F0F1 ATP synthase subunit A [Dehalococcoidia bacterium]